MWSYTGAYKLSKLYIEKCRKYEHKTSVQNKLYKNANVASEMFVIPICIALSEFCCTSPCFGNLVHSQTCRSYLCVQVCPCLSLSRRTSVCVTLCIWPCLLTSPSQRVNSLQQLPETVMLNSQFFEAHRQIFFSKWIKFSTKRYLLTYVCIFS